MNDDTRIKFLVEIDYRLPEPGETLQAYSQAISDAFSEYLAERLEGVLESFIVSWEAGEIIARPSAPGRVILQLANGETFEDEGKVL